MDEPQDVLTPCAFQLCGVCGRTFHPDALVRHERVCAKNASNAKKRKPFDISKQRTMGTELQNFQSPVRSTKEAGDTSKEVKSSKSNWKLKHEQFIQSIRSARAVTQALAKGGPLPEYTPSAPNPDYIQCPHCERRFQQETAERHIPFCKEKSQRMQTKANSTGKDKLNKRIQYKPPSLKKKSAGTSKGPPPGSSVVMKQSNFTETYTVNSTDGVNGGVPTGIRSGSVRGNVVVAHAPESKKTGLGETKVIVRKTTTHETSKQSPSVQSSSKTSARTMKTGSSSYNRAGDYNGMNIGYNKMGNDIDTDSLDSYSRDSLVEKPKRKMVTRQKRIEQSSDFDDDITVVASRNPVVKATVPKRQNDYFDPPSRNDFGSRNSSSSSVGRSAALTEHGMPVSKFCYECGSKYPVPQAKYCCMCGTRRL